MFCLQITKYSQECTIQSKPSLPHSYTAKFRKTLSYRRTKFLPMEWKIAKIRQILPHCYQLECFVLCIFPLGR